jgi:hypothetical protein
MTILMGVFTIRCMEEIFHVMNISENDFSKRVKNY